jgi:hypothetical protein
MPDVTRFAGSQQSRVNWASYERQPGANTGAERPKGQLPSLPDGHMGSPSGECRLKPAITPPERHAKMRHARPAPFLCLCDSRFRSLM